MSTDRDKRYAWPLLARPRRLSGGGGLLAGSAVAAKSMRPKIKVIAAEPANADDAAQSFRAGKRIVTEKKFTIADGLRTGTSPRTEQILSEHAVDRVPVEEAAIEEAIAAVWERTKQLIEPSAAVAFAAARMSNLAGRRIAIISTGANTTMRH